jgi:hypothetical protein
VCGVLVWCEFVAYSGPYTGSKTEKKGKNSFQIIVSWRSLPPYSLLLWLSSCIIHGCEHGLLTKIRA